MTPGAPRRTRSTPSTRVPRDVETRERLLRAALELFAEHGFAKVTVRDISRQAEVNLAAVSYHYGDKLGLYGAVVKTAIDTMRTLNDASMDESRGKTPEDKLRHYIHTYLPRLINPEGDAWVQKLMRHEMREPTPLAKKIAAEGILPRIRFLEGLVSQMLQCEADDAHVQRCVMSIQAQCLFHVRESFKSVVVGNWLPRSPAQITAAAEHVSEFSIAGIHAIARARSR